MTGPLLESQHEDTSLVSGNVASTVKTLDGSTGPSGANASNGKRRYFVIKQAEGVKMGVSIHETPAPSKCI